MSRMTRLFQSEMVDGSIEHADVPHSLHLYSIRHIILIIYKVIITCVFNSVVTGYINKEASCIK